jgi:hypothetical protein
MSYDLDSDVEEDSRVDEENGISMDFIRDAVVGEATLRSYTGDILQFLEWVLKNKIEWLTNYGKAELQKMLEERCSEGARVRSRRIKFKIQRLFRRALEQPLLHLDAVLPEDFMNFVRSLRHKKHGTFLGKSAYGNKRSALFHLFRMHNKVGFSEDFQVELGNLYWGFYRRVQQYSTKEVPGNQGNAEGNVQHKAHQEGKEPLSVAAYTAICRWFFEWGTIDGLFGWLFTVLSWNLACRSKNTALIRLHEITWASSFHCYKIKFGHMKNDQSGADAKYSCHLYANPLEPLVCPVYLLALYFSCCINTPQVYNGFLFPGHDQHQRYSVMLQRLLDTKVDEVKSLGYNPGDIGTHSIRKGAITYLSSLVGGPPMAAVCLRAGWTMGKVKDIYMRYVASGDQFTGQSLSVLPILLPEFAASPPHFTESYKEWAGGLIALQFPMISDVSHLQRLCLMCLASTFYHKDWLNSRGSNHVAQIASILLHDNAIVEKIGTKKSNMVTVLFPWNDKEHAYSGIPPHVTTLQQLTCFRHEQRDLIDQFVPRVKRAIQECGLAGNSIVEERFERVLEDFTKLTVRLEKNVASNNNDKETGGGARKPEYHCYDGKIRQVPRDWRFPRCGLLDLWRQWWIGDFVRGVPPLQNLQARDLDHLDRLPLEEYEKHGRKGKYKDKRRPARKVFSDMSILMKYITTKVKAVDGIPQDINLASVDAMFRIVAPEFGGG